jgi:hypothetical protein
MSLPPIHRRLPLGVIGRCAAALLAAGLLLPVQPASAQDAAATLGTLKPIDMMPNPWPLTNLISPDA